MRLRFFVLAALFSLGPAGAQELAQAPPVAPPATSAEAGPEVNGTHEPPVVVRTITAPLENCDQIRFYPREARRRGIEGLASLDCLVEGDGRLSCTVLSEEPAGFGFGEAALQISTCFRMQPRDSDGELTAGGNFRVRLPFRLADN